MSYLERAIEISTANENCQDDNWSDWVNLCRDADLEIKLLNLKIDKLSVPGE